MIKSICYSVIVSLTYQVSITVEEMLCKEAQLHDALHGLYASFVQ